MIVTKSLMRVFTCLLLLILVLFGIANNSFEKGKFTCNKYILNTYLYVILTFNIIAIIVLGLEHLKISYYISVLGIIGLFLITIGMLLMIHLISPNNIVLKHCVWLMFVILISITFYPMFHSFKNKEIMVTTMLTTILLTVTLSMIAYWKPKMISFSLGPILFMLLLAGIIFEISFLLMFGSQYGRGNKRNLFRIMSYLFIIIFMGYILYDTKMLQIRAKECVTADYIKESLHLFLDIFNIFVRLLGLSR